MSSRSIPEYSQALTMLFTMSSLDGLLDCPTLDTIGYNPYKYDSFVKLQDETPVYVAERAWLNVRRYFGRDVPKIQAEGAL